MALPDPGQATSLADLVERLRRLKVWAGDPSYETIKDRVNAAWTAAGRPAGELARRSTVAYCFRPGRQRLDTDLVVAVVQALHPDIGYVTAWRQALRVVGGEIEAVSQVRVQDSLPQDLAGFTGRTGELDQLRHAAQGGQAVVISAIEGMAGVGKTQLAVHAGHLLHQEQSFERVLFVNLRGFDPDPAQLPADPAAVLDGFLRLLGMSGQQIPHTLDARVAAYRARLAGTRALVVLDNAATTEQVLPLLPATPGCLTLVTSRRSLTDLQPATRLTVDVFTPDEANEFLSRALPGVLVGADQLAAARIAARCGYLPLALGLVAGHIRGTPGWTLTDHADRLDERHRHHQLDSGVQLALTLSCQRLRADQQRILRLLSLHPGQDFDAYAAAALTGTDKPTVQERLQQLCSDHLLQQTAAGRYSFHDLVRAYATGRATDEDPPPQRRTALTRLLDFYTVTAAAAMDAVYPYERQLRPVIAPAGTTTPDLAGRNQAEHWLDTDLANLLAAGQFAAAHDWPEHTWRLSDLLDRHLLTRGRYRDAQTLHQNAFDLARHLGNQQAEMKALTRLGFVDRGLGRYERAGDHYGQALQIAQAIGDHVGELQALTGLGYIARRLGRHEQAVDHNEQAVRIAQAIGDGLGELHALNGLGDVRHTLGHYHQSGDCHTRALRIAQVTGDRGGELHALNGLGDVHHLLGDYHQAGEYHRRALRIAQAIGDRGGERMALHGLALVHRLLGHYHQAGEYHRQALRIARVIGERGGELGALNGLGHLQRTLGRHGEAVRCYQQVLDLARNLGDSNWQFEALQGLGRLHHAAGDSDLALNHHHQALQTAIDLAQLPDQARAHDGLAHAHHTLNHHDQARRHWRHALEILADLGTDHTSEPETSVATIRTHLTDLETSALNGDGPRPT